MLVNLHHDVARYSLICFNQLSTPVGEERFLVFISGLCFCKQEVLAGKFLVIQSPREAVHTSDFYCPLLMSL